jgi:hypothetical protein
MFDPMTPEEDNSGWLRIVTQAVIQGIIRRFFDWLSGGGGKGLF